MQFWLNRPKKIRISPKLIVQKFRESIVYCNFKNFTLQGGFPDLVPVNFSLRADMKY
jgi:hypothetical protein